MMRTALLVFSLLLSAAALLSHPAETTKALDIGSRLELFVDDYLIDTMAGARLTLHQPVAREIALNHNAVPWEGNTSLFHTVFQDGPLYRMYYRGKQNEPTEDPALPPPIVSSFFCYAESDDGVHWRRPELGLVEFQGSKKNNILWSHADSARLWDVPDTVLMGTDDPRADDPSLFSESMQVKAFRYSSPINFTVFKDTNPDCPPEARYKLMGGSWFGGAWALKSADGIHFTPMVREPVIPPTMGNKLNPPFAADTAALWDSVGRRYLSFHRAGRPVYTWREHFMSSSADFLHWSEPVYLEYPGAPVQQLYTNSISAYARAPHILLGFPMRFTQGRKATIVPGTTDGLSDGVFMTSRDGVRFRRWAEAFVRPGLQADRWVSRNNAIANGVVVTESDLVDAPDELSIYVVGGYYGVISNRCRLRRHTIRMDGFVSAQAPFSGGELVTKPVVFEGKTLVMNYSTSAAGSVSVELQSEFGKPIEGFTLGDCGEIYGDEIERVVSWKGNSDLSKLAGTPVRLRFVIKDGDLYSIRFRP